MNREAAKLIRALSSASGKSEKALKREYYSFDDKKRFQMKQEIKRSLKEMKLINEESSV